MHDSAESIVGFFSCFGKISEVPSESDVLCANSLTGIPSALYYYVTWFQIVGY